jgi:hypothetical protein
MTYGSVTYAWSYLQIYHSLMKIFSIAVVDNYSPLSYSIPFLERQRQETQCLKIIIEQV